MKKSLLFFMIIFSASFATQAQDDIDQLIKGSVQDANYLVKGYAEPVMKIIGHGLNQGWYNTAKPHKLVGINLTLTASPVYFSSSDLTYKVENAKLTNLSIVSPSPTNGAANVPTILGSQVAPVYQIKSTNAQVSGPPGVDLKQYGIKFLPVPMLQLGIGLPKGTDLKVRYVPNIDLGDNGSVNMWGVGVMHDVKQYIPGVKKLPFDLSAFVGYTKLKLDVDLSSSRPDQKGLFESSATTVQAVVSKKIAVLTFYGGLGYNFSKTKLAISGAYDLDDNGSYETKNPVDFSVGSSGPRITGGLRLKLAIFTFQGDYTIQKYNSLSVGFGLSVR